MTTVITYGTFDLLHEGHVNILRRAKALGDRLIVGVTSDDYDRYRGKLNVRQSLAERIAAVRDTGYADKIIIEEYDGQKIEDIKKHRVDIITLGSDWTGKLDFLNRYCKVVYLPRTEHISSTLLRTGGKIFNVGIFCDVPFTEDDLDELKFVAGIDFNCLYTPDGIASDLAAKRSIRDCSGDLAAFAANCDVVYANWCHSNAFAMLQTLIAHGRHVLTPHACGLSSAEMAQLSALARERGVSLRLASPLTNLTSYTRLKNIAMSGTVGRIARIDVALSLPGDNLDLPALLRRMAPVCLRPITDVLGFQLCAHKVQCYTSAKGILVLGELETAEGVAGLRIAQGIPVEGRMVLQGDSGFIKVPAPWWDMDYFELHNGTGHVRKFSWPSSGRAVRYQLGDFIKGLTEGVVAGIDEECRLASLTEALFDKELRHV